MKRSTLAALVACAGLSGACSETDVRTGIAGLSGTYDVTLVNDLVFVTSSDQDQLRVLDLSADPKQFIPAPNPLQALAIPVLERPDALTKDVGYNAEGADLPGPYVYARSSGSSRISVVAAERQRLQQLHQVEARSLVTSFAARSPAAGSTTSTLYYAMQDPDAAFEADTGGARVMRQELPGPDALSPSTVLPEAVPVFCLQPGESIQSMVVMQGAGQLVVATRQSSGRSGRTLLITDAGPLADCLTPTPPTADLTAGFNNFPVRLLATHPRVAVTETVAIPANRYVYGILDEAACAGARECTGVLAVDMSTSPPGQLAKDASGAPMLAIFPPGGLPTGLSLMPGARLRRVQNNGLAIEDPRIPLLGIMPASNGSITLFSANELRHFDLDDAVDEDGNILPSSVPSASVVLRDRNELPLTLETTDLVKVTQDPTLASDVLYEGSVQTSVYRFVFQGALQGLVQLPRSAEDPRLFEAEAAAATAVAVRPGDLIVLDSADTECATALTITSVDPVPGTSRVRFGIGPPETVSLPVDCAVLPTFTVRAGGDQPFVLLDGGSSFLSRNVLGTPHSVATDYFYHPQGFTDDARFPKPPPPLQLRVVSVARELVRGDRYVVSVDSGIRTFVFGVDNDALGAGLALYTLPGSVASSLAGNTGLAYIAYPSADGILQVNLEVLIDNLENEGALVPFE
ncbi:hypothetical protein ACLESO_39965 [Pyxidicoccus sp. 3LG]